MDEITQAVNNCISSPGLAIHGAASALVKYSNTFQFKANGRLSAPITTADAPSLALATLIAPMPNGVAATVGSLATGFTRVYSLIGTLPITGTSTAAATFSWVVSTDFATTSDLLNYANIYSPNQSNQTIIGAVVIANATGSAFVPNTTALDTGSLTVTYINNAAQVGE